MTDPELRDSSPSFQMLAPSQPPKPPVALNRAKANSKVFVSDRCEGPDTLGVGALLQAVAGLAAHKNAETPFCIGVLGGAGSGKSFALAKLKAAVAALTAQPSPAALTRVHIVNADAAHLDGEPMTALAGALGASLGQAAPDLVEEASRAVRDPHAAALEAADRLDQAQRRLHSERDNLSEMENRRARLFETVLYETPGSQVDVYAKTNRSRIANRLQAFGFSGDPILNYKDLVASLATAQSPGSAVALGLRSLWAFKGQTRLIVIAFILAIIGWGFSWAVAHQSVWLTQLQANDRLASVSSWFGAHMGAISALAQMAYLGAGLAICVNIWRAFRFMQPVLRGITLLKADLANKRHALDSAYAHQTRRVDGLATDVEQAARLHADADAHAGKAAKQGLALQTSPFATAGGKAQAANFGATLAALMAQKQSVAGVPQRILFVLDNLDAVPAARACEILDAAHGLLSNAGFVTIVAANPQRLTAAVQGVQTDLEKWVQVPVRIDAAAKNHAAFVAQLTDPDEGAEAHIKLPVVGGQEDWRLDQPLLDVERQFLGELAPLAGASARSLKRFVNLYRLTRMLMPDHWASLAFMLALKSGGTASEREAIDQGLIQAKPGTDLDVSKTQPGLADLLSIVKSLEAAPTVETLRKVAPIAASFSF